MEDTTHVEDEIFDIYERTRKRVRRSDSFNSYDQIDSIATRPTVATVLRLVFSEKDAETYRQQMEHSR